MSAKTMSQAAAKETFGECARNHDGGGSKVKRDMKVKKGYIVLVSAMVIAWAGVVAFAVYNYKTLKSVENNFTPAEITIAVQEDVSGMSGGTTGGDTSGGTSGGDTSGGTTGGDTSGGTTGGDTSGGTSGSDMSGNSAQMATNTLNWEQDTTTGTYTAAKKVWIENLDVTGENNTDAYIRVCIVPRWVRTYTDASGNVTETDLTTGAGFSDTGEMTGLIISRNTSGSGSGTFTVGDITFTLADNWSDYWIYNSNDGYFYYKEIVAPGNDTQPLIARVSISEATYNKLKAMNATSSAGSSDTGNSGGTAGDTTDTDGSGGTGDTSGASGGTGGDITDTDGSGGAGGDGKNDTENSASEISVVDLRIDILADAIQTGGNAVETRWKASGIKIDADTKKLQLTTEP